MSETQKNIQDNHYELPPNPDSSPSIEYVSSNTLITNPPYEFIDTHKTKLGHSTIGGVGVYATENIKQFELIERCPLVPLEFRSKYIGDRAIWKYCYSKPLCDCADCKSHGFVMYMVLGHGMIYNHQDQNNAEMKFNHKDLYVDIVSSVDISANQEIFTNYGSRYFAGMTKKVIRDQQ